jgi:3-methyladenine DNA glycosylase AlkD
VAGVIPAAWPRIDTEFFIRKAIGWVSRRDPDWVAAWAEAHPGKLSGVTFREAVRRLPAAEAARLTALRASARAAAGRPR